MAKYIQKGKVKNACVFTDEELAHMWVLMNDGLQYQEECMPDIAKQYEPYVSEVYKVLNDAKYFSKIGWETT